MLNRRQGVMPRWGCLRWEPECGERQAVGLQLLAMRGIVAEAEQMGGFSS